MSEKERWANVEGVFNVTERFEPHLKMILIDDVVTTGATAASCAGTMISSGADMVMVLAGGRALLRGRRNSY